MSPLKLVAEPTFKAKVGIPVAGGKAVEIEFTFKHRTKKALDEFIATLQGRQNAEIFMDMVVGWNLADPFNAESVDLLLENYIGAAVATWDAYFDELYKAKRKN